MADYDALVKALREHRGWALNETLDAAADAIEELSKRYECPCWYGDVRFCSMLGKTLPEPPKEE